MKILIVDDREDNQYLLETVLSSAGYSTGKASDGKDALAALEEGGYSLVISDILMPVMDGFELCRRMKADERFKSLGFIYYTATYTGPKDEEFALLLGADRFLQKPCDPGVILEVVKTVLDESLDKDPVDKKEAKGETGILKLYNERLIRKLEQKMIQTENEIHSRVAAEESLKLSNLRLNMALASSGTGLWDWNLETGDLWFSSEFKEQLGYGEDELPSVYEEWESRLHPEDKSRILSAINDYLEGRTPRYDVEFRLRHRGGYYIWIASRGKIVYTGDEQTKRFLGSHVNVTSKKLSEQELRASLEELSVIHDSSPIPMVIINRNMIIKKANKAAARLFGWNGETKLRTKLDDALGCEGLENLSDCKFREVIEKTFAERQGLSDVEVYWNSNAGTTRGKRFLLVSTALLPINKQDRILVCLQDVSEKKEMERKKQTLETQLYQAQKMESVGLLAGGIAHDFNNLLTVILSYSGLMRDGGRNLEFLNEAMDAIHESAQRATDLTRQLLAFSRKQILEVASVDVNDIIRGFHKMIRRLLGEDIKLEVYPSALPLPVAADVAQLEQVLMNLVVNARDAMPSGGVLTIGAELVNWDASRQETIPAMVSGPYVLVTVGDTGSGMDGETLEHIFDPFFTTKEQGKGTGLGLATVYGIVKQHGGYVWAFSEQGKGTNFKIYLPLGKAPERKEGPVAVKPKQTPLRSANIMVVEDDQNIRELLNVILSDQGYTVIKTVSSPDAVAQAKDYPGLIDMIITDVIMPEMNGQEVYDQVRIHQPGIKVLYISGYTNEIISRQGILKAGIELLQKPFSAKTLSDKVAAMLGFPD